jgi:hypothetical protein
MECSIARKLLTNAPLICGKWGVIGSHTDYNFRIEFYDSTGVYYHRNDSLNKAYFNYSYVQDRLILTYPEIYKKNGILDEVKRFDCNVKKKKFGELDCFVMELFVAKNRRFFLIRPTNLPLFWAEN